jgi:dolichol-phosphate mannosyltransferase
MEKTLIFTATYNEVKNIEELIAGIKSNCKYADILIIDDNSPDGTGILLKKMEQEDNNLKVIIRNGKLGLDTAHKFAYEYALSNNYHYLITMDADLSHNPEEIPTFLENAYDNDFVLGSRYMTGGKNKLNLVRFLLSFFGNKLIKHLLSLKCTEFTSSYRAFNLKKMKDFHIEKINSKGYSFFMETIYQINKQGFKIIEIPIIFEVRLQGESKIPKVEVFRTLLNIFRLYFSK